MQRYNLSDLAHQAMLDHELLPDFSDAVKNELREINFPAPLFAKDTTKDLTDKLWCSIDNDDSKDLDQLTFAESDSNGSVRIYIAVADVTTVVKQNSAIDIHAKHNTTSVYTPDVIFPMLPLKLSTNLTSLNENEDRLAVVVEILINSNGSYGPFKVYQAAVHNYAKLAYIPTGAWLKDSTFSYPAIKNIPNLDNQIILQDSIAQKMKNNLHDQGMLTLDPIESQPIIVDDVVVGLKEIKKNRANELIEFFMIAANTAITKYLTSKNFPLFKRVVRQPEKWDKIVLLARKYGDSLPPQANSLALHRFLLKQKEKDPLRFPDLSLAVIKLIGRGEYIVQMPYEKPIEHFGLSLKQYSHTTAPNRRYPDVINQRLLHATFENNSIPYSYKELVSLSEYCSLKESDAEKVERQIKKSAAAMLLADRINQSFDGIITGASEKGTWVRLFDPPIEGKVVQGFMGLDVGDRVRVRLIYVNIPNGFIDFSTIL